MFSKLKKAFRLLVRYGYLNPFHTWTFIYNNFMRRTITREKGAYLLTMPHTILDIHPTAHVHIRRNVRVGVHETKKSYVETSVLVGAYAQLSLGGGGEKGSFSIGYGSMVCVHNGGKLDIGGGYLNREVKIVCNNEITIGSGTIVAMNTVIRDNDGGHHRLIDPKYENAKPIHIGNRVWIGENSMILKGVTIGDGAVVAAGSLVIKDVPTRCLVGGHPARILRENIEWEE